MPRLIIPTEEPITSLRPRDIDKTYRQASSGAMIGDTQRTQGASAAASGAAIGQVAMSAGQSMMAQGNQVMEGALNALDDANYNSIFGEASLEYSQRVNERLNQPYDANGNPTFSTLPTDIASIGTDIQGK